MYYPPFPKSSQVLTPHPMFTGHHPQRKNGIVVLSSSAAKTKSKTNTRLPITALLPRMTNTRQNAKQKSPKPITPNNQRQSAVNVFSPQFFQMVMGKQTKRPHQQPSVDIYSKEFYDAVMNNSPKQTKRRKV
jgi:hypothetical protein